jgi:hypothetical protein
MRDSGQRGDTTRSASAPSCGATSAVSVSLDQVQFVSLKSVCPAREPVHPGGWRSVPRETLTAYCRHLCLLVADGMSPLNLPVAKAFGSETEYIGGAFLIGSGIMLTFSESPSIGLP